LYIENCISVNQSTYNIQQYHILKMTFKEQIQQGIPSVLPQPKPFEANINHAPKRKEILSDEEKK
jgi:hypothetical protein